MVKYKITTIQRKECFNNDNITGKKNRFFKVFKVAGKKCITAVSKKKRSKNKETDHGGFQQQSPQRLVASYEHMNSRNDR